MEPFAIRCTTCKARLKVRDPQALGQILPCPKCGSMVLVERSAAAEPISGTPATGQDGASTGAPAAAPVTTSNFPGTDAFEQIDRLLDPTPRAEPSSAPRQGRWKREPHDLGSTVPAAKPVAQPQADSEPEAPSAVASDDGVPDASSTVEQPPGAIALGRRYALVAGGALVGTMLAVGVTATVLLRPPRPTAEGVAATVERPTESAPQAPAPADQDRQADAAAQPPAAAPVEEPSPETSEPAPIEPSTDEPPPDPIPSDPVEATPVAANAAAEGTESPPAEPAPDAAAGAAPPAAPTPTELSELPGVRDDALANFARWLNTASADPLRDPPLPPAAVTAEGSGDATAVWVQPSRPAPQPVDVAACLQDKVAAIEFKDAALVDVLRTLTELSTIPISVDPAGLGRRMLSPRTPVNLLRKDATFAELLQAVLEPLHMGYLASEGHVLVTTQLDSRGQQVTIRHDLTDLAEGRTEAVGELARWLTQLVAYGTWQDQGGSGSFRVEDTVLVVDQLDTVQYQILIFCEKLRVARGLAPRSRIPETVIQFEPTTQRMLALQRPVTLRIWQEQNLNQIAARCESEAGITVLVNWQALHVAGWSPEDRMRFFCQEQPLQAALHSLLDPMGLTFRVVDEATLEISSPEAVAARNDVEFYRLPTESQSAEAVQALSARIVQRVGQPLFQPIGSGALAYDLASQTLIVSLPQTAQQQLQELVAPPPQGR